ncbi:TF26 protein, partial [Nyctibius bracteatus]|nr:TF26 protein [Nyctibius bracteatus]
ILQDFTLPKEVKLVQYVDDLLIAGKTEEETREATIKLLNFLGEKGLKVSRSKLQFVEQEVKYLGHWLSKGQKKLDPDRVSGIIALRPPQTKKEIRQML